MLVESDTIRHGVLNGWGRLSMGFGNAIEGERSVQRLVELVWWGGAVPGGTIEDHDGETSSARGRSRWEILKTMCWTQKGLIPNLAPQTARHASFTKLFLLSSYTSIKNPCLNDQKKQH